MSSRLFAEKGFVKGLILDFEQADDDSNENPSQKQAEWIIGRDKDQCSMLVEDPKVSRRHLICKRSNEGTIVENLSQTNPLIINEKIIEGPYLLKEGDRLKIGNSYFRYSSLKIDPDSAKDSNSSPTKEENSDSSTTFKEPNKDPQDELLEAYDGDTPDENDDDFDGYSETLYTEREVQFEESIFAHFEEVEKAETEKNQAEAYTQDRFLGPQKNQAPQNSSRFLLKILAGPMKGAEYPIIEGQSYIIGSNEDADLVFHDVSISRQHAKLSILEEQSIIIEDLESRNGVFVDEERITEQTTIAPHHVVTLGTSAFVVIDKEKKAQTLQSVVPNVEKNQNKLEKSRKKSFAFLPNLSFSQMSLLAVIAGIFMIIGLGTFSLFQDGEVMVKKVDAEDKIREILAEQEDIEFHYNKGSLFLLGHVTSSIERDQIMHDLTALAFVKNINNNIIIDELVWQETNLILAKNPSWNSISLQAPKPGQFVLTGYLKSNQEAEDLSDYINLNFPYLDRLSNKVVVEEQLVESLNVELLEHAFHDIFVEINSGELSLSGYTSSEKATQLQKILSKIETLEGIRSIKNFVVELPPEESMIDLSQRYEVTGHFRHANVNVSVVINGRILARGDTLDGMTITSIKRQSIFLEREGFKFKIDYNK